MPELPELRRAAVAVDRWAKGQTFSAITISALAKYPLPPVPGAPIEGSRISRRKGKGSPPQFSLSARSSGKEMFVRLQALSSNDEEVHIRFNFGMSGKWAVTKDDEEEYPKHSHMRFHTHNLTAPAHLGLGHTRAADVAAAEAMVLHFVDTRRFGRWDFSTALDDLLSSARGPDPVEEHEDFKNHVLAAATGPNRDLFEKRAICELMHDQRFFNGIGNYLRAEILHRANIPPFTRAIDALAPSLPSDFERPSLLSTLQKLRVVRKGETKLPRKYLEANVDDFGDLLGLCRTVPREVISGNEAANPELGPRGLHAGGKGVECDDDDAAESKDGEEKYSFGAWLQCYFRPDLGAKNLVDRQKRTVWFHSADPGPLAPKDKTTRHQKRSATEREPEPTPLEAEEKESKRPAKRRRA